jgi:thiol-disulfide isomerase/thioredoxin
MHFKVYFRHLILVILISYFSIAAWSEPSEIRIKIEGLADTSFILAHYLNKSIYPDDTIELNSKGEGIIKNKKGYKQGMYVVYLPSGKYFELMMGRDQVFSISTDTIDFINDAIFKGSEENTLFFDFQKYMISKQDELKKFQDLLKNSDNKDQKKTAREGIEKLTQERKDTIMQIVNRHPDLFVSAFLKATVDIEVPDAPINDDGTIDSTWQYKYYKKHYFDNFDPNDGRLLFTPIYEDKIMYYLEKVALQIPDSLIREVDMLIDGARKDSTLFRYLLITLFNHFGNSNIMGFDAIQVHLAEKYYLQDAWWSDEKFLKELKERVEILKPLQLGQIAPDIELLVVPPDHFKTAENDTTLKKYPHVGQLIKIHDIQAEFIVLFFWEATCSHCKKAVPKMYSIYKEQLEPIGVKVIAISTLFGEDGKEKWIDFVNNNHTYDWINAWNPYDYQYKIIYDVRTTPQIFILDKDKKIIGKRISPEQVPELIEAYKKQFGNAY